jgi:2-(1,2-epoxy-1,2-dihydrophenyl)acetyl-CoA isomerase
MSDAPEQIAAETPLLVETEGRLRILTLNRPERLNALTPELHHHLRDAIADAANDANIGAVILTGAGRAFCSGGDVKRSAESAENPAIRETVEERADSLRRHGMSTLLLNRMAKPTIALINGAAAGAGLALALACDLRFAARDAVLRTAYARIALAGDLGVSYFLSRLAGPARARELMFLDETVSAEGAARIGLVNRVFEADELLPAGRAIGRKLAEGPGVAFRYMKQSLALAETEGLEQVIEREAYNSARCVRTEDVREATAAFREKRAPRFRSR